MFITPADALRFDRDGRDWPHRETSRFVQAGGLRWHVQRMGQGRGLLLIHGTGASTHSFRGLMPLLAARFDVVALDLPGHGFTERPGRGGLSLPGMARGVGALLRALDFRPEIAVGHSAGAAVALRMGLDRLMAPPLIVSLNGALRPFEGLAGQVFVPMARVLARNPLVPRLFAWQADRAAAKRLLANTGSRLDPQGVKLYARLFANPSHAASALGMMANWDLAPLQRDLPRLDAKLLMIVGEADTTIPASDAPRTARRVKGTEIVRLAGLGHLAHEERPEAVAALIDRHAAVAEPGPRAA